MVATQEDLVISAIDDGLMECESEFAAALQDFDADLIRAFDTSAKERLQSIAQMNTEQGLGLDMEELRASFSRCRVIFLNQIDAAVSQALSSAESELSEQLEAISDVMLFEAAEYSQVDAANF